MTTKVRSTHRSIWLREQPLQQQFASLDTEHSTEVLILGAGITGLSIALELLDEGREVTVCEANVIGSGTTGGSSGHLDAHPEMGPKQLINHLGNDKARQYVQLRRVAIDTIEQRAGGGCDFTRVPGYYYSEDDKSDDRLREQCQAADELGFRPSFGPPVALPHAKSGYRIDGMARMDCMAYLRRLADLVVERGGKIFENTIVSGPTDDAPKSLSAGQGKVSFDRVVCAVHCNFTDAFRIYFQTPAYQSYVSTVRIRQDLEDALFWDDQSPYFYTRRVTFDDPKLILVGGCDHRTGDRSEAEAVTKLEGYIRQRFDVEEIVSTWSAELFEPSDGLPLIGQVPGKENVWIATGLSGVGLTLGTVAGKLIADQIAGRSTPLEDELSPSRFGVTGAATMIAEQTTTMANLAERVLPADRLDDREFAPGEGAVGKLDGEYVAACRDRDGCEHRHSPLCTHMGGVVHWNEVEQTWDCSVHGGRFTPDGTRLYGPPEERLSPPE
ncbi:MAG: FAD-dependent oxidoreductase [Planctomycetota bacterium]